MSRTFRTLSRLLIIAYAAGGCWPNSLTAEEDETRATATPQLVTDRALERTGFQEAGPYDAAYDLRTDFVMPYGVSPTAIERMKRWEEAGYVLQLMTGVAWGSYQDYLDGKVDGRKHWDEGQVDPRGNSIDHGPTVPYMVPAVSFANYLEAGVKRAIDAGAVAVHLEEPEFWARAGFSEAFKREWQIYYNEPWQRPDTSCDAQYRASKLKYYLYRRTLDRLCSAMKEYALVEHNRPVRFYVPTHSLLNYAQWAIVSPESALNDLPGIDGYIAQIWTGTSRTHNTYEGRTAERTFETAYLEYGNMQELTSGTGRRMWYLHDPIEDNPRHDWNDYRSNYIRTLVASLLQPEVWHYEVSPWPSRVFRGRFPRGSASARTIGQEYATTLAVVFNQLRDMKQEDVEWPESTEGVGVFLGDSAMFQRAEPALSEGLARTPDDPLRQTRREVHHFSAFYGLTLPLVKQGIPVRPAQLDNILRNPGYLDRFKVLVLSYEFMKPLQPGIHAALANWVRRGGSLIYVGADTDPFNRVREWWNQAPSNYRAPSEHLMQSLGLERRPKTGEYGCGKGLVLVERSHPAFFSRSQSARRRLLSLVKRGVEATEGRYIERNSLHLRRGPYVIAAAMEESIDAAPLHLDGPFVDLLDPRLAIRKTVDIEPGNQAWLLDLKRVSKGPLPLAAAGRIETWKASKNSVHYTISTPQGIVVSARLLLPKRPRNVAVDGKTCEDVHWHEASRTLLIRHAGRPEPIEVELRW